jgi:hypothetical protein
MNASHASKRKSIDGFELFGGSGIRMPYTHMFPYRPVHLILEPPLERIAG